MQIVEDKKKDFEKTSQEINDFLEKKKQAIERLSAEKASGFPFLLNAINEYYQMLDNQVSFQLDHKRHPAHKAADIVRQYAKERRDAEYAARKAKNILEYCIYLAPWLQDYLDISTNDLDEMIKEIHMSWEKKEEQYDEEVKRHVGSAAYKKLSDDERLELKLSYYWGKKDKSPWQLGREYERYIGYCYEKEGYRVSYEGRKGFEDFGRDLIVEKNGKVEIIQCKRWSQFKEIHEKHILYLYGTIVEYGISRYGLNYKDINKYIDTGNIKGVLATTTKASVTAKEVAKKLGIIIREELQFRNYPSVKCNIQKCSGEKIFHLPFDQQYDTVRIEVEKGECYVDTVREAISRGFRHAKYWMGNSSAN